MHAHSTVTFYRKTNLNLPHQVFLPKNDVSIEEYTKNLDS